METETKVAVKADGSGMIYESMLMKSEMAEQMKQMNAAAAPKAGTPGRKPAAESKMYKLEDLKKNAANYGPGVRFVSVKDVKTATHTGYVASYAFRDVGKVQIDQSPQKSQGQMKPDKSKGEYIRFSFQKGKEPTLVIMIPERKMDAETAKKEAPEVKDATPADPAKAEQELKQIKMIFDGMRMAMRVEVQGKIKKTTASHVSGSTVTLYDIEFTKMLDNTEKLKELNAAKPKSMEEVKALLKGIPGITFEPEHEVKVTFGR
jgi:hypothetical protein